MLNNSAKTLILLLLILTACGPSERSIKKEIEKANYCQTADDCALAARARCPFGCYVYVNKAEADRIAALIKEYDQAPRMSRCMYGCIGSEGPACINTKCTPILPE